MAASHGLYQRTAGRSSGSSCEKPRWSRYARGETLEFDEDGNVKAGPGAEATGEWVDVRDEAPSRNDAEAAKAAIEAIRKGQAPATRGMSNDGGESSSDDEGYEPWEGGGAHPDDIEYPLPGSDASCDACGTVVNRYYHCLDCPEETGLFDLCSECCAAVYLKQGSPRALKVQPPSHPTHSYAQHRMVHVVPNE